MKLDVVFVLICDSRGMDEAGFRLLWKTIGVHSARLLVGASAGALAWIV